MKSKFNLKAERLKQLNVKSTLNVQWSLPMTPGPVQLKQ